MPFQLITSSSFTGKTETDRDKQRQTQAEQDTVTLSRPPASRRVVHPSQPLGTATVTMTTSLIIHK